jgi:hypothetical protein
VAVTQLKPSGAEELALMLSGTVPRPSAGTVMVPLEGFTERPLPDGVDTLKFTPWELEVAFCAPSWTLVSDPGAIVTL